MGEHIFRVLLSELATVRIVCRCGTAIEVPLEKLSRLDGGHCSGCNNPFAFLPPGQSGRLAALQRAIENATASDLGYHIEFPLPIPDSK